MISEWNPDWMQNALILADHAAKLDEVPVGAVVIHEGRVVGKGYNQRECSQNPLGHAEIYALMDAAETLKSWRLIGCSLYVTLEPCLMCLAASQQARIQEIYYGATDKKGGAISLGYLPHEDLRTHHRFPVTFREVSACSQILKTFFTRMRLSSKNILEK